MAMLAVAVLAVYVCVMVLVVVELVKFNRLTARMQVDIEDELVKIQALKKINWK